MNRPIAEEWKRHFVACEDALASFYALQDKTQATLEQSHTIRGHIDRLAMLVRDEFAFRFATVDPAWPKS